MFIDYCFYLKLDFHHITKNNKILTSVTKINFNFYYRKVKKKKYVHNICHKVYGTRLMFGT